MRVAWSKHGASSSAQSVMAAHSGAANVLVLPAPAGLHDADPVALLGSAEGGHAAAEPRADDRHVVVEPRHRTPPSLAETFACPRAGRAREITGAIT
jgi:hypothetical protein